jgi:cardiolipin synthase
MTWTLALEILLFAAWGLGLLLILHVLSERRSPSATAAWVLVIFALPYVGALMYLLTGARKVRRRENRIRRTQWHVDEEQPLDQASDLDRMLRRLGCAAATRGNRVELHIEAEHARRALLEVIGNAREELYFLMYSFDWDGSGRTVIQALTETARRGVKVRLMVDDLGSWLLKSAAMDDFRAAGGKLVRFKPVWYALARRMANLRNHRKIVVADGEIAWTGGRNVGDDYLADHAERQRWADLSLTVQGPAAAALEEICRSDWRYATGEHLRATPARQAVVALPVVESEQHAYVDHVVTQVIASGPDQREDLWHIAFIKSCFSARERLWMVTPYFVPDDAALNAICTAARCGVDVRLLIPWKSDNALVDLVSRSYLRQIQSVGVKVHRYKSGMMHSKALLSDEQVLIGSANLDARSFFLNYEIMLACHSPQLAAQLAQHIEFCAARSAGGVRSLSRWRETLASVARLLAPML